MPLRRPRQHASRLSSVLLAVLLPARAWADEAPADAAPACPTPAPRTAHVTLHAEPTVALESHAVGESHWTGVCTAPCNRELPLDADYRVSSDDLRPSGTLRLVAAPGERVTLDVHPVSRRTHTTGLVLLGTGLVLLVAGDVMSDIFWGSRPVRSSTSRLRRSSPPSSYGPGSRSPASGSWRSSRAG